jgi:2-oxoglutarate dehydrogenase E2 component (dihydrolipoamide succinyltransferase)
MSIEIKVPALPESVSDATLVAWHKNVGESVRRDENLVDLETDKVVLEVPAPAGGVLEEIRVSDGTTVTAGEILAVLSEGDPVEVDGPVAAPTAEATPEPEPESSAPKTVKTSPAVRRLLEEHDLEATMIEGSGKDGRLTKADVMAFLKAEQSSEVTPADTAPLVADAGAVVALERSEQRVPMNRLRARIAERLVQAQQTAAMLTTFNEVDLTEVMAMRARYKDSFQNASVEDSDIVYHNYYDIGISVSTDRGLMVPVLRDVDQMSFAQFEAELGKIAEKARAGTIGMDDLTGGTFTITNGGIFGSMIFSSGRWPLTEKSRSGQ